MTHGRLLCALRASAVNLVAYAPNLPSFPAWESIKGIR